MTPEMMYQWSKNGVETYTATLTVKETNGSVWSSSTTPTVYTITIPTNLTLTDGDGVAWYPAVGLIGTKVYGDAQHLADQITLDNYQDVKFLVDPSELTFPDGFAADDEVDGVWGVKMLHNHSWSFNVVDGTNLVATCGAANCPYNNGEVRMWLNVGTTEKEYDGQSVTRIAEFDEYFMDVFPGAATNLTVNGVENGVIRNAGEHTVALSVTGLGGDGEPYVLSTTVTISKKDISGATLVLSPASTTYNAAEQTVTPSVTVDGLAATLEVAEGSMTAATEIGEYTVTVSGTGNFTGTTSATWEIVNTTGALSGVAATTSETAGNYEDGTLTVTDTSLLDIVKDVVENVDFANIAETDVLGLLTALAQNDNFSDVLANVLGIYVEADDFEKLTGCKLGKVEYTVDCEALDGVPCEAGDYAAAMTITLPGGGERAVKGSFRINEKELPIETEGHPIHFWSFSESGAKVTATCPGNVGLPSWVYCNASPMAIELVPSADGGRKVYDAQPIEAAVSNMNTFVINTQTIVSEVMYYDADGVQLPNAPVEPGEYTAKVEVVKDRLLADGVYTATLSLTIDEKKPEGEFPVKGWTRHVGSGDSALAVGDEVLYYPVELNWPYQIEQVLLTPRFTDPAHAEVRISTVRRTFSGQQLLDGEGEEWGLAADAGEFFRIKKFRNQTFIKGVTWLVPFTFDEVDAAREAGEKEIVRSITLEGKCWEDDMTGLVPTTYTVVLDVENLVVNDEEGRQIYPVHNHLWTAENTGAALSLTCGTDDCPQAPGLVAELSVPSAGKTYDGAPAKAELSGVEAMRIHASVVFGEIAYTEIGEGGEEYPLGPAAPSLPGKYRAEAEYSDGQGIVGSLAVEFEIKAIDVEGLHVYFSDPRKSRVYTGEEQGLGFVSVWYGMFHLAYGRDFTVEGDGSATDVGEYTFAVVGVGVFSGRVEYTWKIVEPPLPFEVEVAITAIEAIGEVEYTEECKGRIDAARAAYDALADGQKALVSNYGTLTDAEAEYARLINEDAEAAVWFEAGQYVEAESNTVNVSVYGGSALRPTFVRVDIAYRSASASDLNLAKGMVDGVVPKGGIKFPLTLAWDAGIQGAKTISIPLKADRLVENDEHFLLQLSDPVGIDIGDLDICTVTILDRNVKEPSAAVTPYRPKKGEAATTNEIDANGKISGKMLVGGDVWTLSAPSFDASSGDAFSATVVGKCGRDTATNELTVASAVVDDIEVGVASGTTVSGRTQPWCAWQNLWARSDTKGLMPTFKNIVKVLEIAEPGDADNVVTLTFKPNGAVSFAGRVDGVDVSGSAQIVLAEDGWRVTLRAAPKGAFKGWCRTFEM